MLLPFAMSDCPDGDARDDCLKEQKDMMVMLMMMSSQSPESTTSVNSILPMLLMDDGDNNELLLMFMMMNQQQCLPTPTKVSETEETIYRTWRLNPDGSRTLIDETSETE